MPFRVIAIDWCGAKRGAEDWVWLAEAVEGKLTDLRNGDDRAATVEHLVAEAWRDPELVVGLDLDSTKQLEDGRRV